MQMETLDLLARKAGHEISARALITLYTGRFDFVKAVVEEIRKHLGDRAFNIVIRFSVKLAEAAGHGLPITEFSTRSAGFADYRALAREVLEQESPKWTPSAVEEVPEEASSPALGAALKETESRLGTPMEASPPLCTSEGVLFTLEAPDARCVQLAADFNGWIPDGNEMQSIGRLWRKVIPLPPGRYQYRYVVDGGWRTDPLNVEVEPAPWGGYNSVLVLEGNSLRIET
jgi:hypothetical protein